MNKRANNLQEHATLSIECVTPVNIADGTKLTPKEYFYDAGAGRIFFINHLAWHKFIYEHNLLGAYERYMAAPRDGRGLYQWLKDCGYNITDVKNVIISQADVEVNVAQAAKQRLVNEILCQSKLVNGYSYLPGSSIKGMLRTAIIYSLLQKQIRLREKYWKLLCEKIEDGNFKARDLKRLTNDLEVELLNGLKKYDNRNKPIGSYNAVSSVMQGIICSDAYAKKEPDNVVIQQVDIVLDEHGYPIENNIPLFRECVMPQTKFYCPIKIDKAYTKFIGIEHVDDIIKALELFFAFVRGNLNAIFGKNEAGFDATGKGAIFENEANGYLGSGTGFFTKTITAALAPTKMEGKEAIKIILNCNFKAHQHLYKDRIISPRTLKTTFYNNENCLVGLVKVTKYE